MEPTIVNVMKHAANLRLPNGEILTLPPSGDVATCSQTAEVDGEFMGFPTIKTTTGKIVGLPEPKEGVVYYCNMMVYKAALKEGRTDVVMGDSGKTAIRWTAENTKLAGMVRFITHLIRP